MCAEQADAGRGAERKWCAECCVEQAELCVEEVVCLWCGVDREKNEL